MKPMAWFLVLLLLHVPAWGDERSVGLRDVTVLDNGEGSGRIVFKLDPADMSNVAISRASLRFDLLGESVRRVLRIRAYPVTTPWSRGGTTWSTMIANSSATRR
jgi:hypothetical protein